MNVATTFSREARALWSEGQGPVLVALSIGWGLLIGTRMIYPVILPHLQTSFNLSLTAAGLLITVLWLFYAIGQLPAGILSDKFDERTILTMCTISVAIALGGVTIATNVFVLFSATALLGLAISLFHIPRVTLLTDIYKSQLGSALGLTLAIGDLGQTVIPPIAGILATVIAWQVGLGFAMPFIVLTGIGIWVSLSDRKTTKNSSENPPSQNVRTALIKIRQPDVMFITGIFFLYFFIWQSFTAFYPTYLINERGLSPAVASILFGFFFAVGIAVKPIAGIAYDRFGIQVSLISLLIAPAIGFALLPLLDGLLPLFIMTALISIFLGTGTITQSWLSKSFSENMRGTALGIINTVIISAAAGGPVIFGMIADYGYFDIGYFMLAIIIVGAILIMFRMSQI